MSFPGRSRTGTRSRTRQEVRVPGVSVLPPVFVTLTCAFRYGREDLDVLGLTFRKDLFMANSQTFPSPPDPEKKLTRLQERLMKKLGEHAHPFTFEVASQRSGFTGPLDPTWYRSRTWIVAQRDSGFVPQS